MASTIPIPVAPAKKSRLMKFALLAALVVAVYCWWAYEASDPAFGNFKGNVVTKWITDDLEMELVEDFHYVDVEGKQWTASAGSVINGASIPSVFWSVIGGPFEGRFRKASVLHDAACDVQTESWEDVHRMFYDACRCSRVGIGKAQTMYWAVYHFGPRWPKAGSDTATEGQPAPPDPSIAAKADRYFAKKEFTLKEIEACTVAQVEAEVAKWDAEHVASENK